MSYGIVRPVDLNFLSPYIKGARFSFFADDSVIQPRGDATYSDANKKELICTGTGARGDISWPVNPSPTTASFSVVIAFRVLSFSANAALFQTTEAGGNYRGVWAGVGTNGVIDIAIGNNISTGSNGRTSATSPAGTIKLNQTHVFGAISASFGNWSLFLDGRPITHTTSGTATSYVAGTGTGFVGELSFAAGSVSAGSKSIIGGLILDRAISRGEMAALTANFFRPALRNKSGYAFYSLPSGGAFTLALDAGSYSLTGQDPGLTSARSMALDAGAYNLTGNGVDFNVGRIIYLDAGSYSVTGYDPTLTSARSLALDAGAYSVTGNDVTLVYTAPGAFNLALDTGTYNLTGYDVTFSSALSFPLDTGVYTLSGLPVGLVWSGAPVEEVTDRIITLRSLTERWRM